MATSSILLALTGLRIGGGIAVVSRCIAQALDEETAAGRLARVDRVLLLDERIADPPAPLRGEERRAGGSQARFVWQTWRSFRRHRHDLVLFDFVGLARSIALPLPGFPPPRVAIFVHGLEVNLVGAGSRARALRHAQVVLANSEYTAAQLRAALPDLAPRIRVVPLCIDPERVALWEREGASAGDLPREPAALIVGRIDAGERGKGHDALIEAWPRVRERVPRAELWIAGDGDDAPRLAHKARASGAGDAIRFFGSVSDSELGALYRRASVFAMPSRQEGFGLVFAEAMWFGLPCIGATADAAGQVIAAGETGELITWGDVPALADALVRLLSDREFAARMGEAGRRRARERFVYPRFHADLLGALELAGAAAQRT